jgi:hypothetical protein
MNQPSISSSPARRVIGIERDPGQLAEARRQAAAEGEIDSVELRPGDALNLPLRDDEWDAFDLVHARYLLEDVAAFDRTIAALDDWSCRPDAAFWFAMCWAQGFKPESNSPGCENIS